MIKLNFQPRQATRVMLGSLNKKPADMLEQRFGLSPSQDEPKTLEAIGQGYGITRERVRQIEEDALRRLRKSENFTKFTTIFNELKGIIDNLGGIVHEKEFLNAVSDNTPIKHHIRFFLVLGEDFNHLKENDEFHHRWTVDSERAEKIHDALRRLYEELSADDLLPEKEIFSRFAGYAKNAVAPSADQNVLFSLIRISRLIDRNALGEWGRISSPSIRPRGVRDLAFLTMRKHGSPMHFSETAKVISEIFDRAVNIQTVHNELIKDKRFVLVGRGLYALKEWGYEAGVIREVIRKILLSSGPLAKEEIIKIVMKERYVKENTILINLQNSEYFKKNPDGAYVAV